MARRNLRCVILGHHWRVQRLTARKVRRTCTRCGEFDFVDQEVGHGPIDELWEGFGHGPGQGPQL